MDKPVLKCLEIGIKLSQDKFDVLELFVSEEASEVRLIKAQSHKGQKPVPGVAQQSAIRVEYEYDNNGRTLWLKVIEKPDWIRCALIYEWILELVESATDSRKRPERKFPGPSR